MAELMDVEGGLYPELRRIWGHADSCRCTTCRVLNENTPRERALEAARAQLGDMPGDGIYWHGRNGRPCSCADCCAYGITQMEALIGRRAFDDMLIRAGRLKPIPIPGRLVDAA